MKATLLFRITAVLFLLFAAGHTFGFLSFRPPTAEGIATFEAMNRVHFTVDSRTYSYGDWYRGFGLSATASMLFEAFLAWHLGTMAKRGARDTTVIGWALFLWQIPGLALAWLFFGVPPMVLSTLVTLLIAVATLLASKQTTAAARVAEV